jgi:flavin reductase (DIM6/NTAB) family NADH-FMN oxidoreductase RutF
MDIFSKQTIAAMPERVRVNFINSLSGLKSANLIGTCSVNKQTNLAIVSSVVHLGANPPLMAYINRPTLAPRHTLDNIITTGFYTINHVNPMIIDAAHQTSARYPQEISEFSATGLSEYWVQGFTAPFVKESRLQIGLEYIEHQTLLNDTVLVVGKVVHVAVSSDALQDDGRIDIELLESIGVSGLDTYHRATKVKRMAYAKPDAAPKVIG